MCTAVTMLRLVALVNIKRYLIALTFTSNLTSSILHTRASRILIVYYPG